ncbi:hypothetical protein GCM10011369_04550 [Neiella marina]|uniref:Uncharacterized protein n=1 Tax=Neiella marina TaxID=508461 RepID=A0A8J2XN71_9GAMM|nr:AhpA/YtjB family protein [Neiella marina]GGA66111.1 hypothetical protein GCM10011369_04550 [Neiella marina]
MPHSTIRLSPRRRSRFIQLLLAIGLLLVVFQIMQVYQLGRHDMLMSQSRSLTRAIVEQSAAATLPAMRNQDDTALAEMANVLVQNPAIYDVAVYDHQGLLLATNDDYVSLRERLPELTTADQAEQLSSRVTSIYDEGEVVGFMQLTLSYAALQHDTRGQIRQLDDQMRLALILAALAGFLFSGSIRRGIRAATRLRSQERIYTAPAPPEPKPSEPAKD